MKEAFEILVLILLALILAFSVWNVIIQKSIEKHAKSKKSLKNKAAYLELKNRIQLITG